MTDWIPVDERLPEPYVKVLVWVNEQCALGEKCGGNSDDWALDGLGFVRPTHWQPLPAAPEDRK